MKEQKIETLILDDRNINLGTDEGAELLSRSLSELGAGRSILLDKNNKVISGNQTIQSAAQVGINDVIVVETEGDVLVAVKRTDIDLDSKEGRLMAIADNSTAYINQHFSEDMMREITEEFKIGQEKWNIQGIIKPSEIIAQQQAEVEDGSPRNQGEVEIDEDCHIIICPYCLTEFKE